MNPDKEISILFRVMVATTTRMKIFVPGWNGKMEEREFSFSFYMLYSLTLNHFLKKRLTMLTQVDIEEKQQATRQFTLEGSLGKNRSLEV